MQYPTISYLLIEGASDSLAGAVVSAAHATTVLFGGRVEVVITTCFLQHGCQGYVNNTQTKGNTFDLESLQILTSLRTV